MKTELFLFRKRLTACRRALTKAKDALGHGSDARGEYRRKQVEARTGRTQMSRRYQIANRGRDRSFMEETRASYNTPDRWERRTLSMLPGAKFDEHGNLSNIEEMRQVRASRK